MLRLIVTIKEGLTQSTHCICFDVSKTIISSIANYGTIISSIAKTKQQQKPKQKTILQFIVGVQSKH